MTPTDADTLDSGNFAVSPRQAADRAALADILRRVAAGDRVAFEELYRLTSAKLFGVCLRILPGRAEAEEALQEAYLSVWRRAASFDEARGSAMTWLLTLTRNRAVDRLRAAGRIVSAPIEMADAVADPAPNAADLLETQADNRRLLHCLSTLPEGDAGFIRTAFFQGLTYSELARRVAMPLGTVKSRIRRALITLRECLQ